MIARNVEYKYLSWLIDSSVVISLKLPKVAPLMIQLSPLTWLSGGLLLLLALLLFFILYLQRAFYKQVKYRLKQVPSIEASHFPIAVLGLSGSMLTKGNSSCFWFDIDEIYTERLKAIRRARRTIHFETFYMTPGRRVDEFAAALAEKSQAGVEIFVLVDSLGVSSVPKAYWKRLRTAGVDVRFFHRFSWKAPLTYNIRTHRKLLIIDGEIAFVGGMGVSDHWDGLEEAGDTAPWLDTEICLTGAIVPIVEGIFMQHWIYLNGVARLSPKIFNPTLSGECDILVTARDSLSAFSSVYVLFYTLLLAAKKRLWIASPYFLPDSNSRKALIKAKKNGVDVRILTVGTHNDKKLVYYAVRENYRDLLAAGIELYEHQPSMMHAKIILVDDDFVSTGSANLDPRSLFLNDELNLSLAESQLAKSVEDFFHFGFSRSSRIEMTPWRKRPFWQRIVGRLTLFFRGQL